MPVQSQNVKRRPQEIERACRFAGITLSYCVGLPKSFDVASEDAATRKRGMKFLEDIMVGIGEMGGGPWGHYL